ncbi:Rha family transcriptional regulator [Clostridium tertium]|uniref:Rha family transcriptional regulator n=1 Tax=Clostridium tertium TaxID=1559 RepID=A0A9X3XSB2_9CLOT|nr:Rha family transcriptional regulator [Clostridium tertium]MDC4242397.1 Rha family transcriptional regulator [Clostridium tertium]
MSKQLENKLSSREVATMMEVGHPELLRKIKKINEDFTQSKIAFSKYWTESSYKDASGKSNREFLITKRGCEFLAHKTTGTKGNLFTDRYMDRFEQMKEAISIGKIKPVKVDKSLKEKEIEARLKNARAREANILLKICNNPNLPKEYVQVLQSKATEIITGQAILPLPVVERKTYSATEIGQELGISANKVGSLANKHNLKTDEYGLEVWDKAKHSNKEVPTFRYYDNVIPVLAEILSNEKAS